MVTVVYVSHATERIIFEQFDTAEEAQEWLNDQQTHILDRYLIVEGSQHDISDHTL